MAIFDPALQRIAVRVVYDGVAYAGKTTNLQQLCTLFAAQRSNELYTPAELHGRTLFFDWMQIMAGAVCGFPLLCQIASVPGQQVLAARRRRLLETADVVVYVCDSRPSAMDAATSGLELLDDVLRSRGGEDVPLVIQANKQDQAGAVAGAAVVRALGRPDVKVTEAIASEGVGVVDTFMSAIRAVIRSITANATRGALRLPVRRTESATELLAFVGDAPVDPESAAEMLLEEAEAAYVLQQTMHAIDTDDRARAAAAAAAEEILRPRSERPAPPRAAQTPPRAPTADVPTGFIWPAHTGRAVLRSLSFSNVDAIGADGCVAVATESHVAHTSTAMRFADAELARQALVRRARECAQLDRLLVPDTVLVAQMVDDGACWIWTVQPRLPRLDAALSRGVHADLSARYGAALVEAIGAMLRFGFTVDLHPRSFGVQAGAVRYVGEIVSDAPSPEHIAGSVSSAIDAVGRAGANAHALLETLDREMTRKLSSDERSALRLAEAS
jgi:signal recognition particle receptor subunit beta